MDEYRVSQYRKDDDEGGEQGDMRPSDSLVTKLERALDIKLREKVEEVHIKKQDDAQSMTLADLLGEE